MWGRPRCRWRRRSPYGKGPRQGARGVPSRRRRAELLSKPRGVGGPRLAAGRGSLARAEPAANVRPDRAGAESGGDADRAARVQARRAGPLAVLSECAVRDSMFGMSRAVRAPGSRAVRRGAARPPAVRRTVRNVRPRGVDPPITRESMIRYRDAIYKKQKEGKTTPTTASDQRRQPLRIC